MKGLFIAMGRPALTEKDRYARSIPQFVLDRLLPV